MTASTKIKAPIDGDITRAGNCPVPQCGDCPHHLCESGTGFHRPMDIAPDSGNQVYLEVDNNVVKSIYVTKDDKCCCEDGSQYERSVKIDLFDGPWNGSVNTGWKIGTIRFGHVTSSLTSFWGYNLAGNSTLIGTIPTGDHYCDDDEEEGDHCYEGQHVHLEVKPHTNGSVAFPSGFSCAAGASKGSTEIYEFTYYNGP